MFSIDDIAEKVNVTPQQIRFYCRKGIIKAEQIGKVWVIHENELENILAIFPQNRKMDIHKEKPHSKKRPIALSFFSGAMGMDIGLEQAGIDVVLACENDRVCRQTIHKNRPGIALIEDITSYSAQDILSHVGLKDGNEIDIMVGGPPCQSFSTAGKRAGVKDSRGNALLRYVNLAIEIGPKYFVLENVRGLLSCPIKHVPHSERRQGNKSVPEEELPGGVLWEVMNMLKKHGYSVSFNLYNAANFGTPQIRERVVLICARNGEKVPYLVPTHSDNEKYRLKPWRTFQEAVEGLPKQGMSYIEFPENRLKYYRLLKPGEYWKNLPEKMQKEALGASYYAGGGKTGFLRRLAWDKPSPTLVTHPAMPATDLAHPEDNRPLSVEEYKRIQEFPDDWKICGNTLEQYRQIGNAVPVRLGTAIGKTILSHLNGKKSKQYPDFKYSRYLNTDDHTWEVNMQDSLYLNRQKNRILFD